MSQQYGSKYELWRRVHYRTAELNTAVIADSSMLDRFATQIEWLAPAEAGREFARRGLGPSRPAQPVTADRWVVAPGRPTWDGVARVIGPDGRVGALFVEGKGHERELRSSGTRATEPSRATILSALFDVQNALDVPPGTD